MSYGGPNWPSDFATGVVHGVVLGIDGFPFRQDILGYAPTIAFTPRPGALAIPGEDPVIFGETITVPLQADGTFSVTLPATDDPLVRPVQWTWMVQENWPNGRTYDIPVPSGSNATLSSISPVQPSVGVLRYIGPVGPHVTAVDLDATNHLVFTFSDSSQVVGPDLTRTIEVLDGGAADTTYTSTIDGGSAAG